MTNYQKNASPLIASPDPALPVPASPVPASEKPRRRSREEIAKAEIGHTDSTPGINWFLTLFFIALIAAVPIIQNIKELKDIRQGKETERNVPQCWDIFSSLPPTGAELKAIAQADSTVGLWDATAAVNRRMIWDIKAYETELKDRDTIAQGLIPYMQTVITGILRGGNEDAYCGRDGWSFYRRDLDSLTGHGFLDPKTLKRRASGGNEIQGPPQPDPVKAIVDFHDQLAKRGIRLIIVPAPVKPSIYPESFSRRYEGGSEAVQNPSYSLFKEQLGEAGVTVFDPAPLLFDAKTESSGNPLYLKTDTHWTPTGLALVADKLAEFIRETIKTLPPKSNRLKTIEASVTNLGDVTRMLTLPEGQKSFPPETVTTKQVLDGKSFWRSNPDAEILLLGDSFTNIFSMESMGWGEAAGFAEHLSLSLGLPLDKISRNDAGSHATRGMLAADLRRGYDRLAGKRVVVWEFASRELASGNWKMLSMKLGEKKDLGFYAPEPGKTVKVEGIIRNLSSSPRPNSVTYRDHIFAIHLTDIKSEDAPEANGKEAAVYVWSMLDKVPTAASRWRPGDSVRLHLKPWSDVSSKYGTINNSGDELDVILQPDTVWGEPKSK